MKETTHTCDRCGESGPSKEFELTTVTIGLNTTYGINRAYSHLRNEYFEAEWCEKCLEWAGLKQARDARDAEAAREAQEQPSGPTLEDLVRELAHDEAIAARQG
jgi:hypothetical protein